MPKRLMIFAAAVVASTACKEPPDPRFTNYEIRAKEGHAKYDPQSGKLQRLDIDQNKNGRMETFSYWDGPRLYRIETDQDEDGKIDRWEHYDEQKNLTRIGSSSKDDQVEDTWTYPDDNGFLARVETDTDRDGVIDKRETFIPRPDGQQGRILSVVEIGLDRTGKPQRRLYYLPNGEFDRVETVTP